jgi:two-component system, OmpR family, alkaline phosphatase synthesis response regulator PhoP
MSLFQSALLVEDEPSLSSSIMIALRKLGIPATSAATLEDARRKFRQLAPEFLLLDRNLPDGDGIEFCRELRAREFRGAILMLTAIGDTDAKVTGLNAGADDYLPKPFSWPELEARIRVLARRRVGFQVEPPQAVSSGGPLLWAVDRDRLRVQGPRGWTELTPLEFKLASRLIEARGAIVSRDDLLKDVWGFKLLPKTRTVDHFLGRLRKHFEANPEDPRHFLTVRGAGYRFER